MKEIWRDIPGYKGLYQVSDLGNVRSLDRIVCGRNIKGKLLKQHCRDNRYLSISLFKNGKGKGYLVHILVAITFMEYNHTNNMDITIDHINGEKKDNRLCNLEIVTHRENVSRRFKGISESKYTGVNTTPSGKWRSRICINMKHIHLGTFETEIEAHYAYQNALTQLKDNG